MDEITGVALAPKLLMLSSSTAPGATGVGPVSVSAIKLDLKMFRTNQSLPGLKLRQQDPKCHAYSSLNAFPNCLVLKTVDSELSPEDSCEP